MNRTIQLVNTALLAGTFAGCVLSWRSLRDAAEANRAATLTNRELGTLIRRDVGDNKAMLDARTADLSARVARLEAAATRPAARP